MGQSPCPTSVRCRRLVIHLSDLVLTPLFSPEELQLMYKFLKSPGPYPEEVDPTIREQYLEDEEFEEVLGMTKAAFNETPKWKQQKLKEDAGLF
mmetsp:Transcript_35083/g.60448  ORF Transcript_35083/g.60448 Transcript_35083/m.60448 type:complete len:94 (+) Transcript_35083:27-308(+)